MLRGLSFIDLLSLQPYETVTTTQYEYKVGYPQLLSVLL